MLMRFLGKKKRRVQENMQLPLLWQIATWEGLHLGKGDVDDCFVLPLAKLYAVNTSDLEIRLRKSGQKEFKNDLMQAKRQLNAANYLTLVPRHHWEITDRGRVWLKRCVLDELRRMEDRDLADLLETRDENNQTLLINALCCIPSDAMEDVLADASSNEDLFIRAFEALPLELVCGFLVSAHHAWHLVLRKHIAKVCVDAEQTKLLLV